LNYSIEGKNIVLTLSNHILIFSLEFKNLLFIGEAQYSKVPCFIERAVINKNVLYFSATDHHQLFSLSIKDCIQTNTMPAFVRFKLPPEVLSICHAVSNNKLVAICNDNNLRVWDSDSGAALKGVSLDRSG
jgi:WD40 repeat protein